MSRSIVWAVTALVFATVAWAEPPGSGSGSAAKKPPAKAGSGSGSGSGGQPVPVPPPAPPPPADPGLTPRLPASFNGNGDQIRAYVDSLYFYGFYLLSEKNDLAGAKKYWAIISQHYPDARDKVDAAKKQIADAEKEIKARAAAKAAEAAEEPTDDVPPPGGPKKKPEPVGEDVPPLVREEVPPARGDGSSEEDDDGAGSDAAVEAAKKQLAADAQRMAPAFSVKTFRLGAHTTDAGSFPEMQLAFECTEAPKYVTLVFYALSDTGKVFKNERTFLEPALRTVHKVVCSYKPEWAAVHGKMVSGRVEICYGTRTARAMMLAADLNGEKAPKAWWKAEPVDHLGFYQVGQHSWESGTLKAYKGK